MISAITGKLILASMITVSAMTWNVDGGAFKCWEDYRALTDTGSPQYELQTEAWTDRHGCRRFNGDYCIALGSAYGSQIGTRYIVTLDTGKEFTAVLADQKADCDTVQGHTRDRHGAIIEFVVDSTAIPEAVRRAGDISMIPGMEGEVVEIRRLKNETN